MGITKAVLKVIIVCCGNSAGINGDSGGTVEVVALMTVVTVMVVSVAVLTGW